MKRVIYGIYFLFLILFTIFSFTYIDPNLFYLRFLYSGLFIHNRMLVTFLYSSSLLVFFGFYVFFLFFEKFDLKKSLQIILPSVIILLLSYPAMLSYDIFNYIATAKVLFLYKENPYIIMPIDITHEPLLAFMHAANKTALYGPVWILLTGFSFIAGDNNFIVTLISFKFIIVLFYFAVVYLLWKLSKDLFCSLLFALNPLVLLETIVSGHNDIVMMFFVLASYMAIRKKKVLLAVCLFILSIFIKYATIVLIPLFIYLLIDKYRNKHINWEKVYIWSAGLLFFVFLLSQFREEIYPWYAIWFMPFIFLLNHKKWLLYLTIALSFSLLLRDIPFMLLGTYFGITPILKIAFTVSIPFIIAIVLFVHKIWVKNYFR